MPETPMLSPRVLPQVQGDGSLPMAVTPAALGAEVGQAVVGIGETATSVHREALQYGNQIATLDADNQTKEFLNRRLYDAKTGILNQPLGKDAPAAVDQVLRDYDEHVSKVQSGLVNDDQRIAFQRMAQAQRFDLDRQLNGYEHTQVEQHADQVSAAAVDLTTTQAVQSAEDPEQVHNALAQQEALIADTGRRKGLDASVIAQQQAVARSATNLAVLEQLSSTGQDLTAQRWYDQNKDTLTGADAIHAARLVEAGSRLGESQRIADQLVHADPGGATPSRTTLLATVEKDARLQADPKLRAAVEDRIDHFLGQQSQAKAEAERDGFKQAFDLAKASPDGLADPAVVTAMAALPPEREEQLRAYFAKDGQIHTNPVQMNNLSYLAATRPQDFLAAVRDPILITTVAPADYEKLQSMAKEINNGGAVGNAAGIFTKSGVFNAFMAARGFKTEEERNSEAGQRDARAFNTRVTAWESANNRTAGPDQLDKLKDEALIQTAVSPKGALYGFNAPKPVFSLTPEQRETASRDLAEYAKTNPDQAEQVRANLRSQAARLGFAADRLTDDQYNRAFAQTLIVRDLAHAGDRAGAQQAVDRLSAILGENGAQGVPAPSVVPDYLRDLNESPIDYLRRDGKSKRVP